MNVRIGEVVSELALQRAADPEQSGEGTTMPAVNVEELVERVVRRVLEQLRREWED